MKTFKTYISENHDNHLGGAGLAGEHDLENAEVVAKVNAILGHTASSEFMNPKAAVAQMEAKLALLGLSLNGRLEDIEISESGEFMLQFNRYGDVTGKTVDTPIDELEEEQVTYTLHVRCERLDTGSFKVYGHLAD